MSYWTSDSVGETTYSFPASSGNLGRRPPAPT